MERVSVSATRAFVVAWMALGVAGALDHTIAEKMFGRRFDLWLPHLRYGYVMFDRNPRHAAVFEYVGADGVRHDLADLVATPSLGYKRARLVMNAMTTPMYLSEVCYQATHPAPRELTFVVTEYDIGPSARGPTPTRTTTLRCDPHGIAPR